MQKSHSPAFDALFAYQKPTFPMTLGVFMGESPSTGDTPLAFEFADEGQFDAFIHALENASGWQGHAFVSHANHVVNADGEIVERKAPAKMPTKPTCYVIWGEAPEKGQRPEKFTFKTEEELQYFKDAIEAYIGNERYYLVPDPNYVAIDTSKPYDLSPYVDAEHVKPTQEYIDTHLDEGDQIFVRRDGAIAAFEWVPG